MAFAMCVGWSSGSSQPRRRHSTWARASRTSRRRLTSTPPSAASPSRTTCSTNTRAILCAPEYSALLYAFASNSSLHDLHPSFFTRNLSCVDCVSSASSRTSVCACVRCRATSDSWKPLRRCTRSVWVTQSTRSQKCSCPSAGTARSTTSLRRFSTRATRHSYIQFLL